MSDPQEVLAESSSLGEAFARLAEDDRTWVLVIDLETKRCPLCDTTKPLDDFHRNRSRYKGVDGWCGPCKNNYQLRRRRGDTDE